MVKIICISKIAPEAPSGVVTYYKRLCEYFLNDSEVSIHLVTTADISWAQRKFAGLVRRLICVFAFNSKKVLKFSNDVNVKLCILFALRRYKNAGFNIIHAQDSHSGYISKVFFGNKIPLILTCHFNDSPVEEDFLRYRFEVKDREYLDTFYRQHFKVVDKFIFVSRYVYEKSSYLLAERSHVEVIYNGANFSDFRSRHESTSTLRIINVGFVEARKNQKILLSVARELIRQNVLDFHITIVGDGDDLPMLKSKADEDGLTNYFSFPGWTSTVPEYLKSSDLYIHSALNDNCPYSIIEAISYGLPVLAFKVGGIPEIVSQEYLFELDDYQSLVRFIIKARSSLSIIGKQQYEAISETFSIQNQFERTRQAYLCYAPERKITSVLTQ